MRRNPLSALPALMMTFLFVILLIPAPSCDGCGGDDDDGRDIDSSGRCSRFTEVLKDLYLCYANVYSVADMDSWALMFSDCNDIAIEEYSKIGGCLAEYDVVRYGVPYEYCIINICGEDFNECNSDCSFMLGYEYDDYCYSDEECSEMFSTWAMDLYHCADQCY